MICSHYLHYITSTYVVIIYHFIHIAVWIN